MENYSLTGSGFVSTIVNKSILWDEETTTIKYVFYKNNAPLYKAEMVKWKRKMEFSDNFSLYIGDRKYIRINGKEYDVEMAQENVGHVLPYVMIHDDDIGIININFYQSRNKNALEYDWNFNTGLSVLVNNTEYGIIAFYPKTFYLKNGNRLHDKIVFYLLTAYVSYIFFK
jgi:hypothetical protein